MGPPIKATKGWSLAGRETNVFQIKCSCKGFFFKVFLPLLPDAIKECKKRLSGRLKGNLRPAIFSEGKPRFINYHFPFSRGVEVTVTCAVGGMKETHFHPFHPAALLPQRGRSQPPRHSRDFYHHPGTRKPKDDLLTLCRCWMKGSVQSEAQLYRRH